MVVVFSMMLSLDGREATQFVADESLQETDEE
jgi:hypothetical protein